MLPQPKNYAIWPSVVPADKPVEMTITPTEKAFLLFEDKEYSLTVIDVNSNDSYYTPTTHKHLNVRAHGGVIKFTETFAEEQEHIIILKNDAEVELGKMVIYSLNSDLCSLLPLRGDFHGHSYRSDGKRDPSALIGHYREQGYDFMTLTDHNRFYPGLEIDETFRDVKMGITRVRGEELHCPGSVVHIVHAGGKSSVTEKYVHPDESNYDTEIAEYLQKVPENVPEDFRELYGKAMWATDKIHEAGGIAIFPHPFWRPDKSKIYNVRDEYAALLLKSGMFDAYEVLGGMKQPDNNISVNFWNELRAEGNKINVVGSSDVHKLEASPYFPNLFTICFAEANENDAIIDSVRRGYSVAVEGCGTEYEHQYRAYGSYRLVKYAQFLLKYYFPCLQRTAQGEGVAIRAYASGEATDKRIIELQAEQAISFRDRFMGRAPAIIPTKEMLDFEDRAREVHLTRGPHTKGSSVTVTSITRQI